MKKIKKKLIEEITKFKSLNLKNIIHIPHYFTEGEEKDKIFFIVMEYNKNLKYNKDKINPKSLWTILIRIIFGLKKLALNNIFIKLDKLDAKYIYFDENYNIKFDLISSEYINQNTKYYNEKCENYFFDILIDILEDSEDSEDYEDYEDSDLKKLYDKKIESLNEFINDKIFIKKIFESNLLNEISEIGDYLILYSYFKLFFDYFNLKKYENINFFEPLCQNCNSLLNIYIKDEKTLLLKCRYCLKTKSEKISDLCSKSYDMFWIKNVKNEKYQKYKFKKYINFNPDSLFNDCDKDINDKYIIVKKIIDNLNQNYTNGNNYNSNFLKEVISNILKYFFYNISIQLNLFLLSKIIYSISNKSIILKIIKNYFCKKEVIKFKDRVKKEEEKYLLFYDDLSKEEINIINENISNIFKPDSLKNKKYLENNLLFTSAIKKYISSKKIKIPYDSININESLNNFNDLICSVYDSSNRNFILSLLGKCLEENGIEVYISKKENKDFENIELASLQSLVSFVTQKKYELHFDFGENVNKNILYNPSYRQNFLRNMKMKLSEKLNISSDNIIFTNIHHGSLGSDLVLLNSTNENEDKIKSLEQDNDLNIERIKEKPFLDALEISPKILDPLGDRYSDWGENEIRGGEKYIPPGKGWIGIGLNVLGKYDNGDNSWLDYRNRNGEFAIAYLGFNNFKNEKQQIISDNNIAQNIIQLQKEKLYKNEKDIRDKTFFNIFRRNCGDGICLFQNPDYAEFSAGILEINKFKIKILLMCRVNPKKIRQPENHNYCWILNPTSDEIRPYRILIKKIPISALTGELNNKIITTNFPINYVISAINTRDLFFYNYSLKNSNLNALNIEEGTNEEFKNDISVIRLYTGDDFRYINNYLRSKELYPELFSERSIRSWIFCLQLALKRNKNVEENTIVYRGINGRKFPSEIGIGSKFYFREFFSTSIEEEKAKQFAGKDFGTIMTICIKNNGTNGKDNYCYYVEDITLNKEEYEVIISSHCYYTVIGIDRGNKLDYVTLICEGYFNFKNFGESVYEGKYINNRKEGFGSFYWNDGSFYKGFFRNDVREGYGKMIWKNNNEIIDIYEGNWTNNEKNGFGIYYWKNGDKYEGEFINDNRTGFGIFYWNDGGKYEGEFKNDCKMGIGTLYYANGDKYEGQFNQAKEGIGIYYYSNGNKYEGEWKNGNKNGKGIFYLKNGKRYIGYWKNNRIILENYIENEEYIKNKEILGNNIIKIRYIDDDIYQGEYDPINSVIKGSGIYYFNNGDSYNGNFKDNLFDGNGKLSFLDGKIIGTFKNGVLNGNGKIYYNNGDIMEGEWINGQKEGIFIETKSKSNTKIKKLYNKDKFIKTIE